MYIKQYEIKNDKITVFGRNKSNITYDLSTKLQGHLNVPKYYEVKDYKIIRVFDGKIVETLSYDYA